MVNRVVERVLVSLFWISLLTAVTPALVAPVGPVRWLAVALIGAIGVFFTAMNWLSMFRGRSLIPPIGGVLLVVAVGGLPLTEVRWWAPLALAIDPWVTLLLFGALARRRLQINRSGE